MSVITNESRRYLDKEANYLADVIACMINLKAREIRDERPGVHENVCYVGQYLLEETISILEKRV